MAFLMDMKASLNVANHVHTAAKVLIKAWLLLNRIQWKKGTSLYNHVRLVPVNICG